MSLDFSIPIMPSFIKMDLSDLPALIGAFALGPVYGIVVELVKNLLHFPSSNTGGVGELSNFLLGAVFVASSGLIYRKMHSLNGAILGSVCGAVLMGLASIPSNYFITYPVYYSMMPKEVVLGAYQAILPSVDSILECLIVFNLPFTTAKGLLSVVISLLVYKPLSPILKGKRF
jgi:riboflavin transporter FmnP